MILTFRWTVIKTQSASGYTTPFISVYDTIWIGPFINLELIVDAIIPHRHIGLNHQLSISCTNNASNRLLKCHLMRITQSRYMPSLPMCCIVLCIFGLLHCIMHIYVAVANVTSFSISWSLPSPFTNTSPAMVGVLWGFLIVPTLYSYSSFCVSSSWMNLAVHVHLSQNWFYCYLLPTNSFSAPSALHADALFRSSFIMNISSTLTRSHIWLTASTHKCLKLFLSLFFYIDLSSFYSSDNFCNFVFSCADHY